MVAVVGLLAGGCAPDQSVDAGMNRYSTDLVMGSPKKPAPALPPAPQTDIDPGFPSFIVPPPPAVAPGSPPPTTVPPPAPVSCPQAGVLDIPEPAPAEIAGKPAEGVYSYRQTGTAKVGESQFVLPGQSERVVQNVVDVGDGVFRYDVAITQFDSTTTTTFEVARRVGRSEVDGVFIVRIRKERPGMSPKEFLPVAPGLRIFALPAREATTWRSVATDPIRATTMSLEGAITNRERVDACGELIEGWASKVVVTVTRPGTASNSQESTIEATYVVAPQLGGLIVSDDVVEKGTDNGVDFEQSTKSWINRLTPVRGLG